jgi:hypothetical protein
VAAAVGPAPLHGVQNPPDVEAHLADLKAYRLEAGIVLFHSGKDLPDLLPVLFDLIHLPQHDLGQLPDHRRYTPDLSPEITNLGSQTSVLRPALRPLLRKLDAQFRKLIGYLGEPSGGPVHVASQDLRESLQRQRPIRISHGLSLPKRKPSAIRCSPGSIYRQDVKARPGDVVSSPGNCHKKTPKKQQRLS